MIDASSLSAGPHAATLRSFGALSMAGIRARPFDPKTFLSRAGDGRTTLRCQKHQTLFTQGNEAVAVFYIVQGRVKLTVVSPQGKEGVVSILGAGNFFGEACPAANRQIRWRCSFTSPFCFHGGQLPSHQSKICSLTPKKLDLCLDVCQNAIDLFNRDREPDRSPMNCLSAFLAVHYAHRGLR